MSPFLPEERTLNADKGNAYLKDKRPGLQNLNYYTINFDPLKENWSLILTCDCACTYAYADMHGKLLYLRGAAK